MVNRGNATVAPGIAMVAHGHTRVTTDVPWSPVVAHVHDIIMPVTTHDNVVLAHCHPWSPMGLP